MMRYPRLSVRQGTPEIIQEKRRQRRYALGLPVCVRIRGPLGARSHPTAKWDTEEETITENISSHGCFFYLAYKPRLGAQAAMEIAIPDNLPPLNDGRILCYGEVIRVERAKGAGRVGVACKIDSYKFNFSRGSATARTREKAVQ